MRLMMSLVMVLMMAGANDDVGGDELKINISQVWPAKVLVGASPVFDW